MSRLSLYSRPAAAILLLLCACAGTPPVKPPPPAPPVHARPAPAISDEERADLDRQYFLAVSAYSKGDYAESLRLVKRILAVEPGNRDALALKSRILAVEKAGAP